MKNSQPGTYSRPTGEENGSALYLYMVALVATVGAFLFGFDSMVFSGAVIYLKKAFDLSEAAVGFAGGSVVLGSILGVIVGGWVSDGIGRKRALFLAALLFGVSAIGTALPRTILMFNIFRIVGGVGMGVAMVNSPMYIAEITPARIRGRLMSVNQFVAVVGALIAVLICYFLAKWVSETVNWRWMFASECVPIGILMAGLLFVPESPRWLIAKKRREESQAVLTRINGPAEAEKITRDIEESIRKEEKEAPGFKELLMPGIRIALLIAVVLALLQQLSGGVALSMYGPIVFQKAGYEDPAQAIGLTVCLFVWHLLMVTIAIIYVERLGRRPLLIIGLGIKALGHFVLGWCFIHGIESIPGLFFLAVYFVTVGISNISIAPLAWLIMAEIFPTRIRSKGMAVATFTLFGAQYVNLQVFPPLIKTFEDSFGSPAGVFIVFGILCIVGVLFIYRMVPETKGKTLEEIADFWLKK